MRTGGLGWGPWVPALAIAASAVAGCEMGPPPGVERSRHGVSVSDFLTGTCSTSGVLELSRQIADEVSCLAPGALEPFAQKSGIVFAGSAVVPYIAGAAKADLLAAAQSRDVELRINSAYRTVVQQYLLYDWWLQDRCGIAIAAIPGRSNHESGRALDLANHASWDESLPSYGWEQTVPGDSVHFDHLGSEDIRGMDVLAFQRLWNRNRPADPIAEDGEWGPETEARVKMAPADGFAIGACAADGLGADLVAVNAPDSLAPGELGEVRITAENTGDAAWTPGATFVGTTGPRDRDSALYLPPSWVSPNRAATVARETAPGEVGEFAFEVRAPEDGAAAVAETFGFVQEGTDWFGPGDVEVAFEVRAGPGGGAEPGTQGESPAGSAASGVVGGGCRSGPAGGAGGGAVAFAFALAALAARRRPE